MLSICSMVMSSLFKIGLCVWQVQLLVLAPVWPFLISTHFLWCVRLWCKYSRHNTESLGSFLTDSQMFTATLSQSSVSKNIWKGGIQHHCTLTKPKKYFSLFFFIVLLFIFGKFTFFFSLFFFQSLLMWTVVMRDSSVNMPESVDWIELSIFVARIRKSNGNKTSGCTDIPGKKKTCHYCKL